MTEGMLRRYSEDLELPGSEDAFGADDNAGMIPNDHFERQSLHNPPSAHELADATNAKENIDGSCANTVVMIDLAPHNSKSAPHVNLDSTSAPKSILKNGKHNLSREVTPAPITANGAKKSYESPSSNETNDEFDEPTKTRLPFITPTPGRGKQTRDKADGFLAMLDKVADDETDCEGAAVANYESDNDDASEESLNECFDAFGSDLGEENQNNDADSALLNAADKDLEHSLSPVSRWPSIHDAFYGLYDEKENVECTSEDMQDLCDTESPTMSPFLSILQEFFFGSDDHDDVDSISSRVPAISNRRKLIRGTYISTVRVLAFAFLLWQAAFPNNKEITQVTILRRPSNPPLSAALHHLKSRDHAQPCSRQSWSELFIESKFWSS